MHSSEGSVRNVTGSVPVARMGGSGAMHQQYMNFMGDANHWRVPGRSVHLGTGLWCYQSPWWELAKAIITDTSAELILWYGEKLPDAEWLSKCKSGKSDLDYVVMLDQMLDYAKDRRLMKGNGNVYEPIESCPCAYRVLCDYQEYVNKSLKHNPETYKMLLMHPSRGNGCVKYLQKLNQEERMPQYTVDKNLLSFSNGVLCLSDMRFVPYDVIGKVARHHLDCDYNASTDTPIIDKILKTNFDDEVASMFYAMVGRLFFEVGKHDNWKVKPYLRRIMETGEIATYHRALVEYDALLKRLSGNFFGFTGVPPIMIDWQNRLAVSTNKLH
eukprot:gene26636-biopygen3059